MAILEAKCVKKIYTTRFGENQVQALSNVSFSVEEGEYVAIMGESGSGKTTLLNILAALDKPTTGQVLLAGKSMSHLKEKEMTAFRRNNLGFVFQEAKKDLDAAITSYQSAYLLTPEDIDIYVNLGSAFYDKEDYKNAYLLFIKCNSFF